MSENKRPYYVPQDYLREFSADGVNIGVFLVETGSCIVSV